MGFKNRRVYISTGIIALTTANADMTIELGEDAVEHLIGKTYAGAKLNRNDKVSP